MQTLSYGYKLPEANDKGTILFTALEFNIQRVNDHDHDGSNSKKLSSSAVEGTPVTILAGNWVDLGNGNYRQSVSIPAAYDFDTVQLSFRLPSGHYVFPTVEKIDDAQLWVYTNDNSTNYIMLCGG